MQAFLDASRIKVVVPDRLLFHQVPERHLGCLHLTSDETKCMVDHSTFLNLHIVHCYPKRSRSSVVPSTEALSTKLPNNGPLKLLSHLWRFAAFPRRSHFFKERGGIAVQNTMLFVNKKKLLAFVRRSWRLHGDHAATARRLHCDCLRSVGVCTAF
jgi:hypothetical protein